MNYGRLKNYFLYVAATCSLVYGSFFDNSTAYFSISNNTPYINGNVNLEDDYKYTVGIRKIALFEYQGRSKFYKGSEKNLSDNALLGAVNGWEYLVNYSSERDRMHKFVNQEYWFKWSNDFFATKVKYTNKESRDLEFASFDSRFRLHFNKVDFTLGAEIKGHPVYGHPPILDYNGAWWELAYDYGYTDYTYPIGDINGNDQIDSYYIWVETDPDTEEGYWEYWVEGMDYYWEAPDGTHVATSDGEFYQYHYPDVVNMYNEDNKEKKWQAEASVVIGLDILLGGEKYYSHLWVNAFPYSVGLTDKAFEGDDIQYDIGLLLGTNLSEHIGVFIEGIYLNYYGKKEHDISAGINWRF